MGKKKKTWMEVAQEVLGSINSEQDKWLRKSVDIDAPDMRQMSTDEIRKRFPGKPSQSGDSQVTGVDDARLIRTFIWESFLMIRAGELKPMKGNMRSFWYRELGPFLKDNDIFESDEWGGPELSLDAIRVVEDFFDDEARGMEFERVFRGQGRELYLLDKMSKSFDQFVLRGFFRFKGEFEFQDPREAFRITGVKRPRYIFFTEKEGLFWLCKEIAKTYGISAVASHGEPGYLTMEYFADALKGKGVKNVEIGALTDYDPWGFNIAENFGEKMNMPVFGFGVNTTHLTSLKLFTNYAIEHKKRDLSRVSPSKKKQVDDWVKATGGIDGKPFGMHVDNGEIDLIRAAVKKWLKQVSK